MRMRISCVAVLSSLLACLMVCGGAFAAAPDRLAVVIANSNYADIGALRNPPEDGKLIADAFKSAGFEVEVHQNLNDQQFRKLTRDLAKSTPKFDATVVYYAGHGVQIDGINYLLPIDLPPPEGEDDIRMASLSADDVLSVIKSKYRVLILDACRDNPIVSRGLSRGRASSAKRGLAPPIAPELSQGGVFIAYSTQADAVALDGEGQFSPFASSFAKHVGTPVSIDDMFALVTREVIQQTNGLQRPFKYASLDSIFCLPVECGRERPASASTLEPTVPSGSSLFDAIARYDSAAKGGHDKRALLDELRHRHLSQFADITVYGIVGGEESPIVFGFEPRSVAFQENKATATIRTARSIDAPIEWDPLSSTYSIDCGSRSVETVSTRNGEAALFLSAAERAQSRLVAAPGSALESLINMLCPSVVSTTPIPSIIEANWVAIGSIGRVPGDTATIASGLYRTDEHDSRIRVAALRTKKFFGPKGAAEPDAAGAGLVALNCSDRKARVAAEYKEVGGLFVQAIASSLPWSDIVPGSVMSNAFVLACESPEKP